MTAYSPAWARNDQAPGNNNTPTAMGTHLYSGVDDVGMGTANDVGMGTADEVAERQSNGTF